jgi:hypothetical protein
MRASSALSVPQYDAKRCLRFGAACAPFCDCASAPLFAVSAVHAMHATLT